MKASELADLLMQDPDKTVFLVEAYRSPNPHIKIVPLGLSSVALLGFDSKPSYSQGCATETLQGAEQDKVKD